MWDWPTDVCKLENVELSVRFSAIPQAVAHSGGVRSYQAGEPGSIPDHTNDFKQVLSVFPTFRSASLDGRKRNMCDLPLLQRIYHKIGRE